MGTRRTTVKRGCNRAVKSSRVDFVHLAAPAKGKKARPKSGIGTAKAVARPKVKTVTHQVRSAGVDEDVIHVGSCGPYWLRVDWQFADRTMQRAQLALGTQWYQARFAARLVDVTPGDSAPNSKRAVRCIAIRPGSQQWFVEVSGAPRVYRIELGYQTKSGRFLVVGRSSAVASMPPSSARQIGMFEQQQRRSLAVYSEDWPVELDVPTEDADEKAHRMDASALRVRRLGGIELEVEADVVVRGRSTPGSAVTVQHSPIRLEADGAFHVRCPLGNGRHVIPVIARTRDGFERRIVVLAFERNTRELNPNCLDGES